MASALDVISLDRLAGMLGIDRNTISDPAMLASLDARLEPLAAGALSFLEVYTGRQLCDRDDVIAVAVPGAPDRAVDLGAERLVRTIVGVRYWSPAGALRAEPDSTIVRTDLGRLDRTGLSLFVYPPAAGWPDALADSQLLFDVTRGATSPIPEALIMAAGVLARDQFLGHHMMPDNHAALALARPFKDLRSRRTI